MLKKAIVLLAALAALDVLAVVLVVLAVAEIVTAAPTEREHLQETILRTKLTFSQ